MAQSHSQISIKSRPNSLLHIKSKQSDMASSSSSATSSQSPKKYDVFISFRGEDTRLNFTSHLHEALRSKQIDTYIDYRLEKGDEVWPSFEKANGGNPVATLFQCRNYLSIDDCVTCFNAAAMKILISCAAGSHGGFVVYEAASSGYTDVIFPMETHKGYCRPWLWLYLVVVAVQCAAGEAEISVSKIKFDTGGLSRESFRQGFVFGTTTSMSSWHLLFFTLILPIILASILFRLNPFQLAHFPTDMMSRSIITAPASNDKMHGGSEAMAEGPEDVIYDEAKGVIYTG